MWKKNLGVDVKLQTRSGKRISTAGIPVIFDVIRASWVGDYNEPSTFLSLLTSTHTGNISRFTNPTYDKILDASDDGKYCRSA
ncbi:periplasmic murein tripeptide transport protein, also negative regulator of mulitple antibiotic resistance [Salmonella enterica subsp. enterica serovar Typhimurium]|nr:periplasmic murein tripeptide transport protein, also negative regulator of mulitple antibiotic resistance [Salmonella enterica subsp. enterica serovar Typhimurium]